MKKIITTVGTSIFFNYQKDNGTDELIQDLEQKSYYRYNEYKDDIKDLKDQIRNWINGHNNKENICAEIKSILKLNKKFSNSFLDIHLLTSDTILSNIAAEIIEEYFTEINNINIKKIVLIKDLQVEDDKKFKNGLINLIIEVENICSNYYENVIFNITGGYKAIIPYITIMAQINGCDIYYIFEDTDSLIKIPKTPIQVDFKIIEENFNLLKELDNGIDNYQQWQSINYSKLEDINGFIDTDGDIALLSPLGKIFLYKYENKFFIFYASDKVWKDINNKKEILRILKTKFCFKILRESKTEQKNIHIVFDDGDNQNRIFYFESDNKLYIYNVFTNHKKSDDFIRKVLLIDKEKIKNESKKRIIEIENKEVNEYV
ncbi:MAG: putative CRISPR-associated protein [Desulfonauticus sp.]|nr:putative CRISPR-associated protein [Desulfonauticus sp.]